MLGKAFSDDRNAPACDRSTGCTGTKCLFTIIGRTKRGLSSERTNVLGGVAKQRQGSAMHKLLLCTANGVLRLRHLANDAVTDLS